MVLLAAFGLVEHQRRNRQPMLELALFRNPALAGACVGALMISASIFSVLLYLTLYLQDVLRYSAFQTGLRFLPLTIPIILAAPVAGRLSGRVPPRLLIGGGLGLIAVGLALMTVHLADLGLDGPARRDGRLRGRLRGHEPGAGLGRRRHGQQREGRGGIGHQQHVPPGGHRGRDRRPGRDLRQHRALQPSSATWPGGHPQLARHASKLAGSLTSGGGLSSVHPRGPGAQVIASAARYSFVTGLDRILWVAAIIAAVGAVVSAVLLRTRDISSAPEASVEHEETMRRAA